MVDDEESGLMGARRRPSDEAGERRCRATTKRGTPCAATVVGSDGLCSAHSGRQDMRELGRRGGKAKRAGVAEQLPPAERESLREALRDRLDVETVIQAIERSLEGGNESARVAAVKFLADLELYKAGGEKDWRKDMQQAMVDARAQLEARINQQAAVLHRRGQSELAQEFTRAATALWKPGERAVTSDGVIVGDYVSSEDAEAVLQGLADLGLIALPSEVERLRAENEQLLAQLAEFTA